MAHWKISVKNNESVNGVRLEKTMFVEMVTTSTSDPLTTNAGTNRPLIGDLFKNKYGVDLNKAGVITPSHLRSERIS